MCFRVLTLLKGLHPKRKCFGLKSTQSGLKTQVLKTLMVKSPLEALVVLKTNVRIRMLKFEFWILALGYTHTRFYPSFHLSKIYVSCLSIYIHDPYFLQIYISCLDHVCILLPACYLIFPTSKQFLQNFPC